MSTPSANGHGEFDLEAAAAASAAEADAQPFAFTFHGKSYAVPPSASWPVAALRAVSNGDLETGLAVLLGQDVFDGLCDDGLTIGALNVLFERIGADAGLSLPNSSARQRPAIARTSKRR